VTTESSLGGFVIGTFVSAYICWRAHEIRLEARGLYRGCLRFSGRMNFSELAASRNDCVVKGGVIVIR
jgi:hypothetical protein